MILEIGPLSNSGKSLKGKHNLLIIIVHQPQFSCFPQSQVNAKETNLNSQCHSNTTTGNFYSNAWN